MSSKSKGTEEAYPFFLKEYGKLFSHFQTEFEPLTSKERGDYFLEFVRRLIPHTELGGRFEYPISRKQTHDEGVDLFCNSKQGEDVLYIQSKYTIPNVDEFDNIISKFKDFSYKREPLQPKLFEEGVEDHPLTYFMVVTLSDLTRIKPKYEKSKRGSIQFYNLLKSENRVKIIHGPNVFDLLREIFRKSFLLPSELILSFVTNFIQLESVYIGIISGKELINLYNNFGDSLFYENIREYLGPTSSKVKSGGQRLTVNEAIFRTLENEPEEFLARNNGITFRAGSVEPLDKVKLKLNDASIVNGCQTTMEVVRKPGSQCHILVKVVQASDTWDIAKAANFQNSIDQLDLELARFVRPQAIRAAARLSNFQFVGSKESSAFAVVDAIYRKEITHDEFVSIFLGFFSNSPRNILNRNYTEVRTDIVGQLLREGNPDREFTFELIFKLHDATYQGVKTIEQEFQGDGQLYNLFQRFWKDNKPGYRAIITILAACGCINWDIYSSDERPTYSIFSRNFNIT